MNKPKFIITGLSRSGTKFLTNVFNRHSNLNAFHDHKIHEMKKNGFLNFADRQKLSEEKKKKFINKFQKTFNDENGYISAAYRIDLNQLSSKKKGLILRHPEKVLVSYFNMHKQIKSVRKILINQIEKELNNLDEKINNIKDLEIIYFNKMVNDKDYLKNILETFGANDINVTDKTVNNKVNKLNNNFNIGVLSQKEINEFRNKIDWFVKKYDLEKV